MEEIVKKLAELTKEVEALTAQKAKVENNPEVYNIDYRQAQGMVDSLVEEIEEKYRYLSELAYHHGIPFTLDVTPDDGESIWVHQTWDSSDSWSSSEC